MRRVLVVLPIVFVAAVLASAEVQDPVTPSTQQVPVFRSRIDVIQLDISVLDKRRRPVRGLTPANFSVTENGRAQKVVAVSEVSIADEAVAPPVWARTAPPDIASNDVGGKRLLAIVIDTSWLVRTRSTLTFGTPGQSTVDADAIDAVWQCARGILERVTPDDLVAVIFTGNRWSRQSFTNDFTKLIDAVDSIKPGFPEPRPPTSLDNLTLGRGLLSTLRDLTQYLGVVPLHRKAVVVISQGMPIVQREPPDLLETLWNAQRSNVNIYTINPFEMTRTDRGAPFARGRRTDLLYTLAENSGGTAIIDPARLDAGLDQLFLENGSYYIVGYQTTNSAMDGKTRKLNVKVNLPGDFTVRRRASLYRPKLSGVEGIATAFRPTANVAPNMNGLLPNLDVSLAVAAMPFSDAGGRGIVPLIVGLTEPVLIGTTRVRQRMEVRATAYDDRGEIRADVTQSARLDEPPTADDRIHYDVLSRFVLDPGRYSVRVVAHNGETGKLGTIQMDVVVPDFQRQAVSLSGVVFSSASVAPSRAFGSLGLPLPIVPTALRSFLRTDRVTAFARVYQGSLASLSAVTLDVKILDARGTPVFIETDIVAEDRFDFMRAADWQLALPLERLKPGVYLLSLQASLDARKTPPRDVRFTIR